MSNKDRHLGEINLSELDNQVVDFLNVLRPERVSYAHPLMGLTPILSFEEWIL